MDQRHTQQGSFFGWTNPKADFDMKIVNEQLKRNIASLEDEMNSMKFKMRNFEEDFQAQKNRADALNKEKCDLLAELTKFRNENHNLKSEIDTRDLTQEGTKKQEASLQRRLASLEEDVKSKEDALNSEIMQAKAAQTEKQGNERRISELKEELTRIEEKYESAEKKRALFQSETEKQKNRIERLECKDNDEKRDAELNKQRAAELDQKSSALQREVGELKQAKEKLIKESLTQQQENEKLRKQDIVATEQNTFLEKSILDLKKELSVLKVASNAREKTLQESHHREIERMRQDHKAELQLKEKWHIDEKKEMQTEMKACFKTLNDDKKGERNTVSKAIEQLAKTNTATNQILNAALHGQAYQAHDVDDVD